MVEHSLFNIYGGQPPNPRSSLRSRLLIIIAIITTIITTTITTPRTKNTSTIQNLKTANPSCQNLSSALPTIFYSFSTGEKGEGGGIRFSTPRPSIARFTRTCGGFA